MRAGLMLVLLTAAGALAQVPIKVGYQGRLLNADGSPTQGMVSIRFDFFAAATGGTSLWTETQTLVLSDGLYSTFLGEVTALPANLFDGTERYLELTIGSAALSPRQRVASVPYALLGRDPRLLTSCADGEVLKWSASASRWSCAPDDGVNASTLANYVTNPSLTSTLASYATTAGVTSTLASYVTNASLASTLASYAPLTSLPTSVDGLAGGSISSGVTVSGGVAATSFSQGGNAVCDTSGNCGATLGSFSPSTCAANQLLQWTGSAWRCATPSSATPSQPCSGAGRALQWDGSDWRCIDLPASGLSGGQVNGYEVRDDWGDVWDGVPRPARTWAEADVTCAAKGARLPTVTELWRNRVSYGTANLSSPGDTTLLWSIAPSHRFGYAMYASLADSTVGEAALSTTRAFRCIWKSQAPAGFTGNRCFGPPGSECSAKDAFFNLDRWSRAPQYFPSAQHECELENAAVATAEDLEAEIGRGATFLSTPDLTWPAWHFTASASAYSNGYDYIRALRWTKNPEPWWGPDQAVASILSPSGLATFRCIGKKAPAAGFQPAGPACQGACFVTTGRTRLVADAADRPGASWNTAFRSCASLGGSLPSAEEFNQLVTAGWHNGTSAYLWSASPATWGLQVYRWSGAGTVLWNPHYDAAGAGLYTGSFSSPTASYPYRCVWREAEASSFVSCPAGQVQLRDSMTGASSCVAAVTGNPNGQQNPTNSPPFIDAWGNAFDLFQRATATYATAKATCQAGGGRLPLATELYRVRFGQGVVGTELGLSGTATQDYLWTLNPEYREGYQTQVRLSDGAATAVSATGASTAPYRCVWPATQPTAFSGHVCYGSPATPCFETGRLRTDHYPRANLTQPAAAWECRFLGGRLASVREAAELQLAGLPNSVAGLYEWSREWAYWSTGSAYAFITARGTNASNLNWQFDDALSESSWDATSSQRRFRCVFTDVME